MNPRRGDSRRGDFERGKTSLSPARRAAFDILRRVETEGAYASVLIAALPLSDLSREDRALAQEIALGVLRWQKALDYFIERYSRRSVERLDLPVLIALRIGLYQLRHLTRIPDSAAVNESVNLVKRARVASAAGMVNAVLRQAAASPEDRAGERLDDPLERLSAEVSHPRWMLERWGAALGRREARALALAGNEPPRLALRINTLGATADGALARLEAEGVRLRSSSIVAGAFILESGPASAVSRAADAGLVYIQDEASQMVSLLLEAKPGDRVLDLCAAPGSKTSHLAALTGNNAWIVAADLHPRRLATLAATCHKLGVCSVDPVALDAARDLPIAGGLSFDRVLVDAPCSGTGTLRRNPEIKWRLAPEDIPRMAGVQLRLLERAASRVRAGGRLVYSTCSIEAEENEGVVSRFLETGAPFRLVRPEVERDLITPGGFVRTYPHRHGTDGFFAAILERL